MSQEIEIYQDPHTGMLFDKVYGNIYDNNGNVIGQLNNRNNDGRIQFYGNGPRGNPQQQAFHPNTYGYGNNDGRAAPMSYDVFDDDVQEEPPRRRRSQPNERRRTATKETQSFDIENYKAEPGHEFPPLYDESIYTLSRIPNHESGTYSYLVESKGRTL